MNANRKAIAAVWLLAGVCVLGAGYRATFRDFTVHPYNTRLAAAARGSIVDAEGRKLAEGSVRARSYPLGSAAVHVVGYKNSLSVSDGMERRADRWLSVPSRWLPPLLDRTEHRPRDLRLTLDADWQRAAHRALGGRRGAVVALDADTGEVLASVSRPGFKPESLARSFLTLRDHPSEPFRDRARSATPPGSTFKLLFVRHLIASGEEDFRYFCPGSVATGQGHRIRCTKPHGEVDLARALAVSCNGYFVRAAMEGVGGSPREIFRAVLGHGFAGEEDLEGAERRALAVIGQGNVRVAPVRMAALVGSHFGEHEAGDTFRPTLVADGPKQADPYDFSLKVAEDDVRERLVELMDGSAVGVRRHVSLGKRCRILGAKTGTAETPSHEDFAWLVGAVRVPGGTRGERTVAFALVVEGISGLSIQHTPAILQKTLRAAEPACI